MAAVIFPEEKGWVALHVEPVTCLRVGVTIKFCQFTIWYVSEQLCGCFFVILVHVNAVCAPWGVWKLNLILNMRIRTVIYRRIPWPLRSWRISVLGIPWLRTSLLPSCEWWRQPWPVWFRILQRGGHLQLWRIREPRLCSDRTMGRLNCLFV